MTTICKKRGAPRQSLANRIGRRRLRESGELYLIMLPVLVMIFIFFYMPMFGVVIAFQDYVPGDPFFAFDGSTKWVGLQHFKTFFSSIYFPRLLKNTLTLSLMNLAFGFWVPIAFALLLNEVTHLRYKKLVQTASYMPYFISMVVAAGMVVSFIEKDGLVNQIITLLGGELFFMVIAVTVFWCVSKREGYYLMIVGFFGTVINQFLKILCCVPRPWIKDPDFTIVESARAEATGYSFPSGHTQNAVATYGGIARYTRRGWLRVVLVVLTVLIAFSRMYLGVHTPLDVGVSFLIAAVLVLVVYPLMEESDRRPVVLTYTILAMVVCSGAFVGYLYLRGDTGAAAEDTANYVSALENGWKLLGATLGMLVSNIADRKHIRFETQAVWWAQLIKLAVGFGCLLAIRSGLKAPLIALLGGNAAIAGGIRYLLVVLFAGCVWPLTFWWFSRLGKR